MSVLLGELAKMIGLAVKSIRYYSDIGLLPSSRAPSRYRRYDKDALARLELIRAVRDPRFDLPRRRRIADHQVDRY